MHTEQIGNLSEKEDTRENNIKMDLRKTGNEDMNNNDMAYSHIQHRVAVLESIYLLDQSLRSIQSSKTSRIAVSIVTRL
jgi:hypothetical protein